MDDKARQQERLEARIYKVLTNIEGWISANGLLEAIIPEDYFRAVNDVDGRDFWRRCANRCSDVNFILYLFEWPATGYRKGHLATIEGEQYDRTLQAVHEAYLALVDQGRIARDWIDGETRSTRIYKAATLQA
jgi:hypothetical protein